jgi:hypothetical protein
MVAGQQRVRDLAIQDPQRRLGNGPLLWQVVVRDVRDMADELHVACILVVDEPLRHVVEGLRLGVAIARGIEFCVSGRMAMV